MTTHRTTRTDGQRECPYCHNCYQPEASDFNEDPSAEQCGACGKHYFAYDSAVVTHHAIPYCDLNGEEHEFKTRITPNGSWRMCQKCGKGTNTTYD